MPNPVDDMAKEVARLREQGCSFSKIAHKLAISKSYAVKLSQRSSDRSPRSVTGSSSALTVRQRKFMRGLVEGKKVGQAAIDAGVPPGGAYSFADRTMKNEKFQETFHQMLERKGLGEERLAEVLADNLNATRVVATASEGGKITDVVERPDYSTRQRATEFGFELHGRRRPKESEESKGPPIIIKMTRELAEKRNQLVGRKVIDLEPPREGQDEEEERGYKVVWSDEEQP